MYKNKYYCVLRPHYFSKCGGECQTVLYTHEDDRRHKTGTSGANLNEYLLSGRATS